MKGPTGEIRSRQQRRSAHTQSRLLDAATAVFVARGYDGLTLGEVTERADLGTGTLYLHFRDKRALYEGVVRRVLASLFERWQHATMPEDTPSRRVLQMVQVAIELLIERPELARVCLLDGPPLESWLIDDVAKGMAAFLDGPRRELRASLIIGAALAACRHYVRSERQTSARQLLETTLAFCAGGLGTAPVRSRTGGRRRKAT